MIGTNRADAVASVRTMLADADADDVLRAVVPDPDAIHRLLAGKQIQAVTFEDWMHIDALEIAAGGDHKPREKFTTRAELLAAARSHGH